MTPEDLECLREAGRIAASARAEGARRIVPGARLREVCDHVEDLILRRGAGLAFPVQSSLNDVAAHYCPPRHDPSVYRAGDVAKLDLGVHVDGWVVDTATTVNVGDRPENRSLVEAAASALEAAIEAARPGGFVRDVSGAIERAVRSGGFRPMRNLCGHGVGRFTVHCPPPVPNVAEHSTERFAPGAVVAIEPFASTGSGVVCDEGPPEVFRVEPAGLTALPGPHPEILGRLAALEGLPFARHQLGVNADALEATLRFLAAQGRLLRYPPLRDRLGGKVAQSEHTVYLGPDSVEVLTR